MDSHPSRHGHRDDECNGTCDADFVRTHCVGFDAIHDIQVLAPIYRGPAGVIALNDRLQEKLNPVVNTKPERRLFGTTFRLGDIVMQTQNNYDKDVYNGDKWFYRFNGYDRTDTDR